MIEKVSSVVTGAKVGSLMSLYAAHASVGKLLIKDEVKRRRFFIENISRYTRLALKAMNFEVEVVGYDPELFRNKNYLIVSNHMSYIDILCLSSVHSAMFITSVDMGEAFFLGTMAELGGSIFVERRHRSHIDRDLKTIQKALEQGFDVVLYPEGTSGNGDTVLPFKKSLLMAAVNARKDILPMTIRYTEIDGEPFSEKNRDKVCWYGDMTFGPHLATLLQLKSVKVQLEFLKPIAVTEASTRQQLAEDTYQSILKSYTGTPRVGVQWSLEGESPAIV